ncbi:MAG: hypothetical protein PUC65_10665 [Clostridiales bacterium]|nr:hypothetical protein [Clostridiales bacterium]
MEEPITTNGFLHVNTLSYSYHTLEAKAHVIKDISFDVAEGEFLAIVGPSGCGNAMVQQWLPRIKIWAFSPSQTTQSNINRINSRFSRIDKSL